MEKEKNKPSILNYSLEELKEYFALKKQAGFRAEQVHKWLYLHQAESFDEMTNLSKELRAELKEDFKLERLKIIKTLLSRDGARKFVFSLEEGENIESVLIAEKDHYTICLSSQLGCAQGCRFCMTAKCGFSRNLSSGEIIAQVRDIQNFLEKEEKEKKSRLSNIVFMGMGEPLANYRELKKAIDILSDGNCGFKFSKRRITVSTAGIVPEMLKLGEETSVNLAVSLNATDNETRKALMPVSRKYSLEELLKACRNYPLAPRQKITFEYILIKDLNDSLQDAKKLLHSLKGIKAKINLIPFNEHEGCDFKRPEEAKIHAFLKFLLDRGYTAIIRWSKGGDIGAACGQLAYRQKRELKA